MTYKEYRKLSQEVLDKDTRKTLLEVYNKSKFNGETFIQFCYLRINRYAILPRNWNSDHILLAIKTRLNMELNEVVAPFGSPNIYLENWMLPKAYEILDEMFPDLEE